MSDYPDAHDLSMRATAGDAQAQFNLAERYANGEGVQQPRAMRRTGTRAPPTRATFWRNESWRDASKPLKA